MGYWIELRERNGNLVSILENAFDISIKTRIDAPEEVVFLIPSIDPKISSITLANEIWVVDSDSSEVIAKTILQTKRDTRDNTELAEIVSMGYLSRLNDELIIDYDTGEVGTTVSTILTNLIGFQTQPYPITIGSVDASILAMHRAFRADGESIFRAILRLKETIGGFIEVDENRQFNWYLNIGEDKGQQIRYGKNLIGIERFIDYTTLKNKLFVYGAGEGEERIKLSDVSGYEEDFIEDVASQALWGGIYSAAFVDRSITHPDTLMAYAEILRDTYKNPRISYQISTIDYYYVSGIEFESLKLGSIIKVIDEDLGIDVSLRVVQLLRPNITKNPESSEIQLDSLFLDITDSLNQVYDLQQFNQHIATTIGAGQVIVKGGFTVLDWASEGETTINGAQITTGSIIIGSLSDDVALMLIYSGNTPPPAPLTDGKLWLDTTDPETPLLKRWYEAGAEWVLIAEDITDLKTAVQDLEDLMDDIFSDGMVTKDESKSLWLAYSQVNTESVKVRAVATALGITTEKTEYETALTDLGNYLATWVNQPEENYPIAISDIQRGNITTLFNDVQSKKTILIDAIETKKAQNAEDAANTHTDSRFEFDIPSFFGYDDYAEMVAAAVAGTTVISGGYINTTLIEAGSIIGEKIAANTITASEIAANTITASEIATGTITVSELNFVPVAGDSIIASINLSEETATINASKLKIGAATTFESGYDPTTIDGGANVTRSDSTSPPSSPKVGDIWIQTDKGDAIRTWNGSSWIQAYTTIDGGNITTGTINADIVNVSAGENLIKLNDTGIEIIGQNLKLSRGTAESSTLVGYLYGTIDPLNNNLLWLQSNHGLLLWGTYDVSIVSPGQTDPTVVPGYIWLEASGGVGIGSKLRIPVGTNLYF